MIPPTRPPFFVASVLYLTALFPGLGLHLIANFKYHELGISFTAILAGLMFDVAWGSFFYLICLSTLRYRRYVAPFVLGYLVVLNFWSVANLVYMDHFGALISYQSILEFLEFREVGLPDLFYGLMDGRALVFFIVPSVLFGVLYLSLPVFGVKKRIYVALGVVIFLSHAYALNFSHYWFHDPRVGSLHNYAYFTMARHRKAISDLLLHPPTLEDLAILRRTLGKPETPPFPEFPLLETPQPSPPPRAFPQKNIILLVLESVRSACVTPEIMPHLAKFQQKAISFNNYYSPARYTKGAHFHLLHSTLTSPNHSTAHVKKEYPNLAELLNEQGYTAYHFDGARKVIQKVDFYKNNGNIHIETGHEIAQAVGLSGIENVDDATLYAYAKQKIPQLQQPYLLILSTITTHTPYYFPESNHLLHESNERNAYQFADEALNGFLQFFEESPLFAETLLVITSDTATGCRFLTHSSEYEQKLHALKVPLLFYHQGLQTPEERETIGAHYDIAPTLLALLQIPYRASFLGKNLFQNDTEGRAILFDKGDYFGLLQAPCVYFQDENGSQKSACASGTLPKDFDQKHRIIESSFRVIHHLQNANHGRWTRGAGL